VSGGDEGGDAGDRNAELLVWNGLVATADTVVAPMTSALSEEVEPAGFEPAASAVQERRSTN
jgi:hypothetical protein